MIDGVHSSARLSAQNVPLLPTNDKGAPNSKLAIHDTAARAVPNTAQETTAKSFETAFIAQMLQFSGLAEALTIGGGEAVESFTQFYLEELAKDISNNGGFGIADKISAYMKTKEETGDDLGRL